MSKADKLLKLLMGNGSSEGEIINARNKLKELLEKEGKVLEIAENPINIDYLKCEIDRLRKMNKALDIEVNNYEIKYLKALMEINSTKAKLKSVETQLNEEKEIIKSVRKGINLFLLFIIVLLIFG